MRIAQRFGRFHGTRTPLAALCTLALVALSPLLALAQTQIGPGAPMADRVPEGTIVYVGWRGGENTPAGWADSHAKAILDQSNLRQVFTQMLPAVINRVAREDKRAAEQLKVAYDVAAVAWRKPLAITFGGVDFTSFDSPRPLIALLVGAGKDADAIETQIRGLVDKIPARDREQGPIVLTRAGDAVVLTIGYARPEAALAGGGKSLAAGAAFRNAAEKVHANPVSVFYVDFEGVLALVDDAFAKFGPQEPEAIDYYRRTREALGVAGLKRLIATSAFEDRNWSEKLFVEAPGPRKGLLAIADVKPLTDDDLRAIPATATFFVAGKFDPAAFIGQLKTIAGGIDPRFPDFIDQGLSGANAAAGTNVMDDVLTPMGDTWMAYCSPDVAGNGLPAMVVANKLDDAERFKSGFTTLSVTLSNTINTLLRQQRAPIEVRGQSTEIDGVRVFYVGLPVIAPSWAVHNGHLFLGFYPQTVATAAKLSEQTAPAGGKTATAASIVDNAAYKAFRDRLKQKSVNSVMFADLPATAQDSYSTLLLITRLGGAGDLFGVRFPEPVLPTFPVFKAHLAPGGGVSWSDDRGFYAEHTMPFPGAEAFMASGGATGMLIPVVAAQTSILLPSLNRARETANRVKSASNLRQIGMACLLYANENRGAYPPDLATIVRTQDLIADVFTNPRRGDKQPPRGDVEAMAQWVQANSDYVYVGGKLKSDAPAETVVAYENPAGLRDGINILYGDGHVEFVNMPRAMQEIQNAGGAGAPPPPPQPRPRPAGPGGL